MVLETSIMLENAQSIKVLLWWRKKLFFEEAFSVVRQKPTKLQSALSIAKAGIGPEADVQLATENGRTY